MIGMPSNGHVFLPVACSNPGGPLEHMGEISESIIINRSI